jgi:hypothetical protein
MERNVRGENFYVNAGEVYKLYKAGQMYDELCSINMLNDNPLGVRPKYSCKLNN